MGTLTLLMLLLSALALPLALACAVAGVGHLWAARRRRSRANVWWGATWLATCGGFLALGLPTLSAVLTGLTPPDSSSLLAAFTVSSAALSVPAAWWTAREHSSRAGLWAWLPAFLLLLLPWVGLVLGHVLP